MSSSNFKSLLGEVRLDFFGRVNYIGGEAQACQKFNKNNIDFNLHVQKISESIAPCLSAF